MTKKHVYIAGDHASTTMKADLMAYLGSLNISCTDLGPFSDAAVDYPDYAEIIGEKVVEDLEHSLGILICGAGIGASIAANKIKQIRAALCTSREMAVLARQHNNANILCMGARVMDIDTARACARAFWETEFLGGRHEKRVQKITALEEKNA